MRFSRGARIALAGAALATGFVLRCQKEVPASSEIKSLDNFAAGKRIHRNACSAAPAKRADAAHPLKARVKADPRLAPARAAAAVEAARLAVTALPLDLQRVFLKFGGDVMVTDDMSVCEKPIVSAAMRRAMAEGGNSVESCFLYEGPVAGRSGAKALPGLFRVVLAADPEAVAHSTVRAFGYVFSQFFMRLATVNDRAGTILLTGAEKTQYIAAKAELTTAFLTDMAALKTSAPSGIFSLQGLEWLLGAGAAQTIEGNVGSRRNVLTGVTFQQAGETRLTAKTRDDHLSRFGDYVVADAFDSLHCDDWGVNDAAALSDLKTRTGMAPADIEALYKRLPNTDALMLKLFSRTYPSAKKMDALIASVARRFLGTSLAFSGQAGAGLALADQGFAPSSDSSVFVPSDVNGFAPSSDVNGFAPSSDVNGFAPSSDVNGFAPSSDVNGFAPSSDVNGFAPSSNANGLAPSSDAGNDSGASWASTPLSQTLRTGADNNPVDTPSTAPSGGQDTQVAVEPPYAEQLNSAANQPPQVAEIFGGSPTYPPPGDGAAAPAAGFGPPADESGAP